MFEDDPRADDFDRYGVVYRPETTIFSRASLSELFKSPDRQEYESFVRMEGYMNLVNHMALDDVINMLAEIWGEHQETIAKEAYSGMVKEVKWEPKDE